MYKRKYTAPTIVIYQQDTLLLPAGWLGNAPLEPQPWWSVLMRPRRPLVELCDMPLAEAIRHEANEGPSVNYPIFLLYFPVPYQTLSNLRSYVN